MTSKTEVETYRSAKIAREIAAKGAGKPCKCIDGVNAALEEKDEVLTLAIPMEGKAEARCLVAKHRLDGGKAKKNERLLIANYCPFCGRCYGE